jgi:preprotein translocase subunit SecG
MIRDDNLLWIMLLILAVAIILLVLFRQAA